LKNCKNILSILKNTIITNKIKILFCTSIFIIVLHATSFAQKGVDKIQGLGGNRIVKVDPCNVNSIELSGAFWKENPIATSSSYIMEIQFNSTNNKPFTACNFVLNSIFFSSNRYVRANEITLILNENGTNGLSKRMRYRVRKTIFTTPPLSNRAISTFFLFRLGNNRCIKEASLKLEEEIL
jgi:hypothetical protein